MYPHVRTRVTQITTIAVARNGFMSIAMAIFRWERPSSPSLTLRTTANSLFGYARKKMQFW
jgi:hypothetical protein